MPSQDKTPRLAVVFPAIFASLIVILLSYIYWNTDIRLRLENLLFDYRVRMIPQISRSQDVKVVAISDTTISALEGPDQKKLTPTSMARIIDATLAKGAKTVAVLLPGQDFDYSSESMWPLIDRANNHANLFFGVFDEGRKGILRDKSSLFMEYAWGSLYAADTNREYRRAVVRYEVLESPMGGNNRLHLIPRIALEEMAEERIPAFYDLLDKARRDYVHERETSNRSVTQQVIPAHFTVNQLLPHSFDTYAAEDLVAARSGNNLSGKIVIIGYTSFRKRRGEFRDGTFVNSSWQSESTKVTKSSGMPLLYVHASALDNLLTSSWYRPSSAWLNLVQTLLVGFLSFYFWKSARAIAITKWVLMFLVLMAVHGITMKFTYTVLPLGDTVIVSLFAAISGAFIRGQADNAIRARMDAEARGRREMSKVQSRFLDHFASDLYVMNKDIERTLYEIPGESLGTKTLVSVHHRAISSCLELNDYLEGIKQLAALDEIGSSTVRKECVGLAELLRRLKAQFESKLSEKEMSLELEGIDNAYVHSSPWFLESILFNLISNAIKYSPNQSTTAVRVRSVSRNSILVEVVDQGPGVPRELQERIFEKFYRIRNDQAHQIKGNGLGLYLSRYFAHKIGTDIRLKSVPGHGATFSIILEVSRKAPTGAESASAGSTNGKSGGRA